MTHQSNDKRSNLRLVKPSSSQSEAPEAHLGSASKQSSHQSSPRPQSFGHLKLASERDFQVRSTNRLQAGVIRALGWRHGFSAAAAGTWAQISGVVLGMAVSDGGPAATALTGVFGAAVGVVVAGACFSRLAAGRILSEDGQLNPQALNYGMGVVGGILPAFMIPLQIPFGSSVVSLGVAVAVSIVGLALASLNHSTRKRELAESPDFD